MKKQRLSFPILLSAIFFCLSGCGKFGDQGNRSVEKFDLSWKFQKGDLAEAEYPDFDDSDWRILDLPHDWSIEDLDPETATDTLPMEGAFYSGAPGGKSTGFTMGGTAWYRKQFKLRNEFNNKRIYFLFEGVYMNSDTWVNGEYLGNRPYGYSSYWYDVTDAIRPDGEENVLAVQVKNEGLNSRWYSGSGIYRHVWLMAVNPFHIAPWGTFIQTSLFQDDEAIIKVENRLVNASENHGEVWVNARIIDADGNEVTQANRSCKLEPGSEDTTSFEMLVSEPNLWSLENPYLYNLVSEVTLGGKLVDRTVTSFGIRSIDFSASKGFLLNGEPVLLQGACMHHDNGPLGARAFDRAEERRVELMKANGYNAIRCAHNPPSPSFLDACDRLGMLVIDEAFDHWQIEKNEDDYHNFFREWWKADIENMVLRDRNHPSVIMWSTGNEIEGKHLKETRQYSRNIADYIRELDPSRAVTSGVNKWVYEPWDSVAFFIEPLDVVGYNYLPQKYKPDHARFPDRIIYGSESFPSQSFSYWMPVLEHEWVIGDFVWTGYDYLGEVSIGWHGFSEGYPWTVAYCGDLDLCGHKRPQSYYRDVLWKRGDKVSVFVHNPEPTFGEYGETPWGWDDVHASWTWNGYEGQVLRVDVYSACDQVQLLLNGEDLGTKVTGKDTEYRASWDVPYVPGELKALGFEGEDIMAMWSLNTVSDPFRIILSADREVIAADGQDLAYINVELVDSAGNRHPFATDEITFDISGSGEIIAIANSNPMSTESFHQNKRSAFQGRCQVIIKSKNSTGRIRLSASAENLEPASLVLQARN